MNYYIISLALIFVITSILIYKFSKSVKSINSNSIFSLSRIYPFSDNLYTEGLYSPLTIKNIKPHLHRSNSVVIIGSGFGSLSTAAILSKLGYHVIVLEQNSKPGGSVNSFYLPLSNNEKVKLPFSIGLNYMGPLAENSFFRFLFDTLYEGQIKFKALPNDFDHLFVGSDPKNSEQFKMCARNNFISELINRFPDSKLELLQFKCLLEEACNNLTVNLMVMKMMPGFLIQFLNFIGLYRLMFRRVFYFLETNTDTYLTSHFKDPKLRGILSWIFGLYGSFPSNTSLLVHAVTMSAFINGPFYPFGGLINIEEMNSLVHPLVQTIDRYGGKVFTNAYVKDILVEESSSKVLGVRVEQSDLVIVTNLVISGIGFYNTFAKLLSGVKSSYIPRNLLQCCEQNETFSLLTVYLGFKGSKEELNLSPSNYWFCSSYDIEKDLKKFFTSDSHIFIQSDNDFSIPFFFCSFPCAKDPLYSMSNMNVYSTAQLSVYVRASLFNDSMLKNEYEKLKNIIAEKAFKKFLCFFPNLKDKVVLFNVASPLTYERYLRYSFGHIHGCVNSIILPFDKLLYLRPKTDISGLYLCGQDIMQTGVVNTLLSSLFTVSAITNHDLVLDALGEYNKARKEGWKSSSTIID